MLILEETRCSSSGIEKIKKPVASDTGFSGGLWLLWNESTVLVEEVSIDAQVINVLIYYGGRRPWLLSAVYVSPDITIRHGCGSILLI